MHCGKAIWPHNEEGLENLARYIIRASFSQERMTYIAADESANGVAKVIYESKSLSSTPIGEWKDRQSSPGADDPPSLLLLRRDRLHN